ncbi:MAG: Asp-tRNA(Asn)/Glu-tRNA(Gln) amidotransferase subunit GatC [Clostridia bacterium]|nr:Asp-tRNA(Asn)/Glu-tRNA(Gln) amidotransferase subunit GatC [Clostridia bacterium]NLS85868.1 Asp-tRNA(Asn)/Glu-tRNA(Gln) amidotransferase subunit GatC [Oscillospiraceae bacterium]
MEIDVKHIAKLAMLRFSDDEVSAFEKEFEGIVKMVENLPNIESASTLLEADNLMTLREDEVVPSYPRDELMQNVPVKSNGSIVVPKTVD